MTLLDFRKPKCVVLNSGKSYSGKYWFYYGYHYHAGKMCYIVGVRNETNGELIQRHYNENECRAPKSDALAFYHEFKEKMRAAPKSEEHYDRSIDLANYISKKFGPVN